MAKPCDNTPETPEGTPPLVMRQARPREYLCGFADLAQQLQPGHCAPPAKAGAARIVHKVPAWPGPHSLAWSAAPRGSRSLAVDRCKARQLLPGLALPGDAKERSACGPPEVP